jgi:hypothetical protein
LRFNHMRVNILLLAAVSVFNTNVVVAPPPQLCEPRRRALSDGSDFLSVEVAGFADVGTDGSGTSGGRRRLCTGTECRCLEGYYKILISGAEDCVACPAGKFLDMGGYRHCKGIEDCLGCTSGKYSPIAGSSTCATCPIGYTSLPVRGGTSCIQDTCSAGEYITSPTCTNCTSCGSGQYKSGTTCSGSGSNDTQTCTACSLCASGQYQTGTTCSGSGSSDSQTCTACLVLSDNSFRSTSWS